MPHLHLPRVAAVPRAALAGLVLLVTLLSVAVGSVPTAHADVPAPVTRSWPLTGAVRAVVLFDPPAERWGRGHRGVDLAARLGDVVLAAADGRVTVAKRIAGRGVVVVDHGSRRTTYEPVDAAVTVGTRVEAGMVIGRIGSGGHCSARCLHWGLIEGKERYHDPLTWVPMDGPVRLLEPGVIPAAARLAARRTAEATEVAAQTETVITTGTTGRGDFVHPVPGAITSPFGMRFHPIRHVWKLHDGTDFGASCGTPIRAPADGRVTRRSYDGAYGHRLMLDHGRVEGRHVVTGYNHATRYVVSTGTTVTKGQVIGYVGSTGFSTGCHLHLMVWLDSALRNPMTWFAP